MLAYVGTEAPRERQQLRLILTGTLLSLVPCVALNVLAHVFPFLALPGFVRILPALCFPLALGYALLRPQLFLLERVVNHITRWFLRGLAFPLVVALLLAVGQHAYPHALTSIGFLLLSAGALPRSPFLLFPTFLLLLGLLLGNDRSTLLLGSGHGFRPRLRLQNPHRKCLREKEHGNQCQLSTHHTA